MWSFTFICLAFCLLLPASVFTVQQDDIETLAKANAQFALDLYNQADEETDGNIFFSPISVSIAFAMVQLGAKQNSMSQMANVLQIGDLQFDVNEQFKALLNQFNKQDAEYTLSIANRLFGRKEFEFVNEFIQQSEQIFGASLEEMDFVNDAAGSKEKINKWVEDATMNKIEDFLPDGFIKDYTVLVLINAVYFKGIWEVPFNTSDTEPKPFYLNDDEQMDVDMMSIKDKRYNYGSDDDLNVEILSIPYKENKEILGDEIMFDIILPKEKTGLSDLESSLTADKLYAALDKQQSNKMKEIAIPKFEIRQKMDLKMLLQDMGMTDVFDATKADLSGISGEKNLVITDAIHEAYIKVNEEGTEASAATTANMGVMSALPQEPPSFIADHPFIYLIRDQATNSILFMGRFVGPSSGEEPAIGESLRRATADASSALLPTVFTCLVSMLLAVISCL